MPAPLIEWLAEHLGIDIVRQWSLDRSYLELLTTAQLQEVAVEWKLRSTDTKRGDLIEWLTEQQIESLHTLCRSALKSKAFAMSVEMTVTVSGR